MEVAMLSKLLQPGTPLTVKLIPPTPSVQFFYSHNPNPAQSRVFIFKLTCFFELLKFRLNQFMWPIKKVKL